MCLSTVYVEENERTDAVAKNVSTLSIQGDTIVVTDLLGNETAIKGSVKNIDFVEAFILIEKAS